MNKFLVIKDGDNWFFALPDFVNLQESKVLFMPIYNADMNYIFDLLNELDRHEKVEE